MLGLNLTSLAASAGGAVSIALAVFLIGHSAGVKAEQKRTDPKVAAICEAAGSLYVEVDGKGRPLPRGKWGRACVGAVKGLAAFKADALAARLKALAQFQAEQAGKTTADQTAAAHDAQALGTAKQRMEAEDATVRDDRVGGGWFARLNELGGLRVAPKAGARGAVRGAQGDPPF